MLKTNITTRECIDFLNSLLLLDAKAVNDVFSTRHTCNRPLTEHPTVQVSYNQKLQVSSVGPLGILNGLFGKVDDGKYEGFGAIVALRDSASNAIFKFIHVDDMDRELEQRDAPK